MTVALTRRRSYVLAGALLGAVVLAALAYPLFAPKASTAVDQPAPAGAVVLKEGTFRGAGDGLHHASGAVRLLASGGETFLRFEGYEATAGPDVFFYLTEAADPRNVEQVEGGLRVLVPGGSDGGEATLRGSFNVPLPAGTDPGRWQGLAVWCDQFDTLFGNAPLAPADAPRA